MKHINSDKMLAQWRKCQNRKSDWLKRCKGQKLFRLLSQRILIEAMKKKSLSNADLTALVQIFKWRCTEQCFLKYLDRLNLSPRSTSDLHRRYRRLPHIRVYDTMLKACGFTAVGKAKIWGLTPTHRMHIRALLIAVAGSKSAKNVLRAVADYEQHSVPVVGAGIYSPWLHALKPKLCPLVNNGVRPILKAGCWRESYGEAVHFYGRVARIVKQADHADIDRFFYDMCRDEDRPKVLRKRLFDSFDDPEDEKEEQMFAGEEHAVKSGKEGRRRLVSVSVYERDPQLRLACKQKYGTNCVICGFNFGRVYGERANGFIHIHHLRPLSETGKQVTSMVMDLRPVCPNCHTMLHRGPKLITINRLKKEMKKTARTAKKHFHVNA